MSTYEGHPYDFSVVTYLQMPRSNHFFFLRVSGLNKCTYKDPSENPYSFMKHFIKLHQFPMLFHQENAMQFGVIYLETRAGTQ